MSEVVIVDTGGANLASLRFALQRLGCEPSVSRDPSRIAGAGHVLLPGVGAARDTMQRLRATGLDALLPTLRQPVLGICLGMQILAAASDEGETTCLDILPGRVQRLRPERGRPVPHMGWNRVAHDGTGLFAGLAEETRFYFVHSYALPIGAATIASVTYATDFAAAVRRDNFFGTQFHPERSGTAGAQVLANFLQLRTAAARRSPGRAPAHARAGDSRCN